MARRKGSKRLVDVGYGSRENKFGVRFTSSEMKKFRNEVQRVNKRLETYTRQMQKIRQSNLNTIDSRIPVEPLFDRKSTSLQRFRSKDEFNEYISRMRKQGSDNYRSWRFKIEKENYKKAIDSVFPQADARHLKNKINKISNEKIHEAFISKKLEHTGFVYYDPDKAKFNQIMSQLDALV